jgi:hypothetical protein
MLGSDGSYRVHKHRFHRGQELKTPVVVAEAPKTEPELPIKPIGTTPESMPVSDKPTELSIALQGGSGGAIVIGSALALLFGLALLKGISDNKKVGGDNGQYH